MNAFNLKPPSFFGDAKPRDVLRVLTYHPQQFDASVVSIPTASDPLMRSRTCTVLEKAIGDLDLLPLELINKVLRRSDLRTVSTLRLLNRRARAVVDSSFPYKLILLHAPQVVAALEKTGVASHFSVDDVFRALSTPSCGVCGKFGTYLWIPECTRCCFLCVREAPELMPMSERDARDTFGITKSGLRGVPIMVTSPGLYTTQQRPYRRKRHFLSRERARQAALDIHGGTVASRLIAAQDPTTVAQGRSDRTKNDPTRFMTVVPLPYFDPTSRITHVGLSCQGCRFGFKRLRSQSSLPPPTPIDQRDQIYTMEDIFDHFKTCVDARELWRAYRKMCFPTGKYSNDDDDIPIHLRRYVENR